MQERTDRVQGNTAARKDRIQGANNARAERLGGATTARQKRLTDGLIRDLSQREEPPQPTLRREEPRGEIPARRGYAEVALQPGTGIAESGEGIASPLTECRT